MGLRSRATTDTAAAAALAARMQAWSVRRLWIAVLTRPCEALLGSVAPLLESLVLAPEPRARQGGANDSAEWAEWESDGEQQEQEGEGEQEGPGWTQGYGPVGRLARLPPGLTRFEAGSGVECPAGCLCSAPQLRHLSLDAGSCGPEAYLEKVGSLPPLLQVRARAWLGLGCSAVVGPAAKRRCCGVVLRSGGAVARPGCACC